MDSWVNLVFGAATGIGYMATHWESLSYMEKERPCDDNNQWHSQKCDNYALFPLTTISTDTERFPQVTRRNKALPDSPYISSPLLHAESTTLLFLNWRITRASRNFCRLQEESGLKLVPTFGSSLDNEKKRLSNSSSRISVITPFRSQGCSNIFFLGMIIGMMSPAISGKTEVNSLNEQQEQTENLIQDLCDELNITVDEHPTENSVHSSIPTLFHAQRELNQSEEYDGNHLSINNSRVINEIEAELEAELEKLELNGNESSLDIISDLVQLESDFEAYIARDDLRLDNNNNKKQPDDLVPANDAVSPLELSSRLNEVIQSRLEARIMELEKALEVSQRRLHCLISEKT